MANKDFLQYLVDQPSPCCMKPHRPDALQHQRKRLLLLWDSSSPYLHEASAETFTTQIGHEAHSQLEGTPLYSDSVIFPSRLKSRVQEFLLFCKWEEFLRI